MKKRIALFLILSVLTGCTTKIPLTYDPIIETSSPNHIPVAVNSFEDVREQAELIGVKRNGYGIPIVKILTDDNVSEWVANALKLEMNHAGYSITDSLLPTYEIKGMLLRAFTSTYLIYHGRLKVKITVQKNGEEFFEKTYSTKKSGGINWFALDKSCSKTLALNLQEVCRQFINDFNAAVLNSDLKVDHTGL